MNQNEYYKYLDFHVERNLEFDHFFGSVHMWMIVWLLGSLLLSLILCPWLVRRQQRISSQQRQDQQAAMMISVEKSKEMILEKILPFTKVGIFIF